MKRIIPSAMLLICLSAALIGIGLSDPATERSGTAGITEITGVLPGDVNGDGIVDAADLFVIAASWRESSAPPTATPTPMSTATPTPLVHPAEGRYRVEVSGDDSGSGDVVVDDDGNLSGQLRLRHGTVSVEGAVTLDGNVILLYVTGSNVVGAGKGTLSGNSGSGWWENCLDEDGSWTATKR